MVNERSDLTVTMLRFDPERDPIVIDEWEWDNPHIAAEEEAVGPSALLGHRYTVSRSAAQSGRFQANRMADLRQQSWGELTGGFCRTKPESSHSL